MFYGTRYYDRQVGRVLSPDTLVPDATSVWEYGRCAHANCIRRAGGYYTMAEQTDSSSPYSSSPYSSSPYSSSPYSSRQCRSR
jgi:hypothetical protein